MIPVPFPQSNARHGPPEGVDESQVRTIDSWHGQIKGGNCDGQDIVVVAWMPTPEELAALNAGAPVFITMFGGLAPHMLTTNFHEATHLA